MGGEMGDQDMGRECHEVMGASHSRPIAELADALGQGNPTDGTRELAYIAYGTAVVRL